MRYPAITLVLAVAFAAPTFAHAQASSADGDPPTRVGRLSTMAGAVSLYLAGGTDWTAAATNYPLSTGDAIWVDDSARSEVQLGPSAIRLGPQTSLVFGEISDSVTQFRIDQGTVEVYVHQLGDSEVYEIDTPSGVVSLTSEGRYRIDVTPDGRRSTVTVREGSASIEQDTGDFAVAAGSSATLLGAQRRPVNGRALPVDPFEEWANARDARDANSLSTQYVSRDVVGYEDLDNYGSWQGEATYGSVWYPRDVPIGWAPYHNGHWATVGPWGWTWIDDAPWGFAPFHYGRWAYLNNRWGWIPGARQVHPVYAPALVAFIGGAGWGASVAIGGGAAVGWVPLAPNEPYIPAYRVSQTYIRRINVPNVRPGYAQYDVNQVRYVNRSVPGAVTAVSREDFTHARPVQRGAITVRPTDVERARPSAAPLAGDERVAPTRVNPPPQSNDRNGRRPAGTPPAPPASTAQGNPAAPPVWRARPRPGTDPRTNALPHAPPPTQSLPTNGRPVQSPATPPIPPPPPQNSATGTPPARNPGGNRPTRPDSNRPVQPPTTPPVNTPPANPPATNRPPANTPPPMRVRPVPPAADNSAQYEQQRNQLLARHQKEDADLAKRHASLQQHPPAGASQEKVQQTIDAERKAMADKHQHEKDALDKQYRKPNN